VDLWGRVRRLNEAALAQYLASVEAQRGVTLSLVGHVAQAYFELLGLDRLLDIAQRSSDSFADSLKIFNQRLAGGVASRLETSRAEAALASTAANVPELQREIELKENEINVLLGRNPGPIPRTAALLQQALPPAIPAGLPSALLERRPDLREAEQVLRAANAQIGVAVGDFLPRIGLTALYGGVSAELSHLTRNSARTWSLGASLDGPLFQGGRVFGAYRQARAIRQEAALRYQQVALTAFREVADALVTRNRLEAIRAEQERAVRAYEEAVKVSLERYQAGRASYYEVLEAQQQLFPAENALAQTRRDQLIAVVQLYQALGGGWQHPPAAEAQSDDTSDLAGAR